MITLAISFKHLTGSTILPRKLFSKSLIKLYVSVENRVNYGSPNNVRTSRINCLGEHLNMKAGTVTGSYIQSPSIKC